MMDQVIFGSHVLAPGQADGEVVVLTEPLSFWGGYDSSVGRIIDQRHPQVGASLVGKILVMPAGRGSGSSSSVLAEAIRRGTAPRAIILREIDVIITIGATVAAELYGRSIPVVVLAPEDYAQLANRQRLQIIASDQIAELRVSSVR